MSYLKYILYTDNYPAARLEVILLDGNINEKISNRVFIATLPASIKKEDLNYSSPILPINLDDFSLKAVQKWKRSSEYSIMKNDNFFKMANLY
tara:strand:- start:5790 stop:6068 length:279 start_codon:yes stop_codon:yes gene_type:complete